MAKILTDVPSRLDRLPWSRWHWRIVLGLGITWVLDGLEVTIIGAIAPRLSDHAALGLTTTQIGFAGSLYLIGAVVGALGFGYATDAWGRKKLFLITLGLYVVATIATALSWNSTSFGFFRLLAGCSIGGEYAAINSAIDELIPAKRRGVTDIAINGTWWLGTALGSLVSLVLLNPQVIDQRYGWRLAFGCGAILATAIVFVRKAVPESPRWLLLHGQSDAANAVVDAVEATLPKHVFTSLPAAGTISIDTAHRASYREILMTVLRKYPRRFFLANTLMITQAFLYNAMFFTYALVLTTFFSVPAQSVGLYILPFAIGNLLGPLCLAHFFDVVGRRIMISATYGLSGALLLLTAWLFTQHLLNATTMTCAWCIIFFFASTGASAAYLTTSEIFPMETRATVIAIVYSIGTLIGGAAAPTFFSMLIATKSIEHVAAGYVVGATAMLIGAIVEACYGIDAEGKSLEEITPALASS